jgi:hypothetical protein
MTLRLVLLAAASAFLLGFSAPPLATPAPSPHWSAPPVSAPHCGGLGWCVPTTAAPHTSRP